MNIPRPRPCSAHSGRYTAGCAECAIYKRDWQRRRRAMVKNGTWLPPRVNVEIVRAYLEQLIERGMFQADISTASGYSQSFLQTLRTKQAQKYISRGVADILLAVPFQPSRPVYADPTGTRRRLQALAAIGWTWQALSIRCGFDHTRFQKLMDSPSITHANAKLIKNLYRELSGIDGPSARARARAHKNGWAPPIAWDDDAIDDPDTRPYTPAGGACIDELAIEFALRGNTAVLSRLTDAERDEYVRLGHCRGMSKTALAGALHVHTRAVAAVLNELVAV